MPPTNFTLSIPGGLTNTLGGPADEYYQNRTGPSTYAPYVDEQQAVDRIQPGARAYRTVLVTLSGVPTEMWWESDTSDGALHVKTSGSGDDGLYTNNIRATPKYVLTLPQRDLLTQHPLGVLAIGTTCRVENPVDPSLLPLGVKAPPVTYVVAYRSPELSPLFNAYLDGSNSPDMASAEWVLLDSLEGRLATFPAWYSTATERKNGNGIALPGYPGPDGNGNGFQLKHRATVNSEYQLYETSQEVTLQLVNGDEELPEPGTAGGAAYYRLISPPGPPAGFYQVLPLATAQNRAADFQVSPGVTYHINRGTGDGDVELVGLSSRFGDGYFTPEGWWQDPSNGVWKRVSYDLPTDTVTVITYGGGGSGTIDETNLVHKTLTESITGLKTFTALTEFKNTTAPNGYTQVDRSGVRVQNEFGPFTHLEGNGLSYGFSIKTTYAGSVLTQQGATQLKLPNAPTTALDPEDLTTKTQVQALISAQYKDVAFEGYDAPVLVGNTNTYAVNPGEFHALLTPTYSFIVSGTVAIGAGSRTTTLAPNLGFLAGQQVKISSRTDVANYVRGTVDSYDTTSGVLTLTVGAGDFGGTGSLGAGALVQVQDSTKQNYLGEGFNAAIYGESAEPSATNQFLTQYERFPCVRQIISILNGGTQSIFDGATFQLQGNATLVPNPQSTGMGEVFMLLGTATVATVTLSGGITIDGETSIVVGAQEWHVFRRRVTAQGNKQYFSVIRGKNKVLFPPTVLQTGNSVTWDALTEYHTYATLLLENPITTLTIINAPTGGEGTIELTQDIVGGRFLTLPSGSIPTSYALNNGPSAKTLLHFKKVGSTYYWQNLSAAAGPPVLLTVLPVNNTLLFVEDGAYPTVLSGTISVDPTGAVVGKVATIRIGPSVAAIDLTNTAFKKVGSGDYVASSTNLYAFFVSEPGVILVKISQTA